MPAGQNEQYDFFLSRRGSVAGIAREVEDALAGKDWVQGAMTPAQYRDALTRLGLTQAAAARLLGIDDRTSRRWAR